LFAWPRTRDYDSLWEQAKKETVKGLFMITRDVRKIIESCAKEFDVRAVWLFGSAVLDDSQAGDIDLAVEGLPAEKFFDFYARLFFELPKPVDLVDLSQEPPIASIVREKGICIYERRN
jgi:predicted nucleotidyltransferase